MTLRACSDGQVETTPLTAKRDQVSGSESSSTALDVEELGWGDAAAQATVLVLGPPCTFARGHRFEIAT